MSNLDDITAEADALLERLATASETPGDARSEPIVDLVAEAAATSLRLVRDLAEEVQRRDEAHDAGEQG